MTTPHQTLASRLHSLITSDDSAEDDAAAADARLMLLDAVGVALAAWQEPAPVLIRGTVSARVPGLLTGAGQATVWGSGQPGRALDVALANGVAVHSLDFDAVVPSAYVQPAAVLVPCLIALGEQLDSQPGKVMSSLSRGLRLAILLGRLWGCDLHELGWHPSTILGPVAATAAASWLHGLDRQRSLHALGAVASLASGVKVNFGTTTKALQVGEAARRGLLAVMFAGGDGAANPRALEVWLGQLLGGAVEINIAELDSPGDIQLKKYPSCGRMHAAIDACLQMRPGLPSHRADAVEIELNPVDIGHIDRDCISSADEARFSIQYCASAALLDNELTVRQFSPDRMKSDDVTDFMKRIKLVVNPDVPSFGTRVRITARSHSWTTDLARPIRATEADVVRKFVACAAAAGASEAHARDLADVLLNIDAAPSMAALREHMRHLGLT